MSFEKSEYPRKMLDKISTKVLNMQRELERPRATEEDAASKPILIISCHGSDEKRVVENRIIQKLIKTCF